MTLIVSVIHILVCMALIFVVLLQKGGSDMGAAFGGGSSQSLFGAQGTGGFLGKTTAILATTFMLTSLALAFISTQGNKRVSVMERMEQTAPAQDAQPMPAKSSDKPAQPPALPLAVPPAPVAPVQPVTLPKAEATPKAEAPKVETPKTEVAPKVEIPKTEVAPKVEAPKAEAPKAAPVKEEAKTKAAPAKTEKSPDKPVAKEKDAAKQTSKKKESAPAETPPKPPKASATP